MDKEEEQHQYIYNTVSSSVVQSVREEEKEKNIPSLLGIQNVNLFLHTAPAQWLVVIKVDLARLNSLYLSSNSSHLPTSSI